MATKYGTQATKVLNTTPAPDLAEQSTVNGRIHVLYDEFDLAAAITSGDVIKMGGSLIPTGARIMNAFVDSADLDSASAGAFTVGWAASADAVEAANSTGFFNTVDVHTAAVATMLNTATKGAAAAASEAKFKKFTAPVQVQIAVTGTGDQTSGKICLAIFYTFD